MIIGVEILADAELSFLRRLQKNLLYRIARTLFECGLSVSLAKISTHFDQVVDVFYVTDTGGRKVADGQRLVSIRDDLVRSIEEFERAALAM